MSEQKQGTEGVKWLLFTQALLVVLIYVAVAIYPNAKDAGLSLGFLILIGMIYSGWRGMRSLWKK
jgi:hypothetical protein